MNKDRAQPVIARNDLRMGLMLPGGICLLAGLYAALLLIADPAPADPARLPDVHGVVMVLGFLGTLISLERAVALRRAWAYAAPAALGLGGIALAAAPVPLVVGRTLLIVGCAVAVATLVALSGRQHDDPTATQILGAAMAFGAAALWTKLDVADLLPWLVGFVVATVAAERVELARLTMPPWSGRVLLLTSAALLFAATTALLKPDAGAHAFGALLVVLVAGLARIDVARQTIRSTGLPRSSAAALLLGYVWLAVAGMTWLVGGSPSSPERYDTVVHATFLGFAISMVMAHAPVIFPAVLRRPLPYRTAMWAPLVLLQIGPVFRIPLGNGLGRQRLWEIGGILNVAALLLFVATAVWSLVTARRTRPAAAAPDRVESTAP